MALDYTKKSSRRRGPEFLDITHMVIGAGCITVFILALVRSDHDRKLFTAVFALAGLMNFLDAVYQIRHLPHGKKNFTGIIVSFIISVFLFGLAALSVIIFFL